MKILVLGWELPPHNSGGLGVACYQLCKHLALKGVDIDFVVPYQANHSNIDFMRVHSSSQFSPTHLRMVTEGAYDSASFTEEWPDENETMPGGLRSQQKRYTEFVAQLVRDNDYDAIHAHDWLTYEAGLEAKRVSRKPLIVHVHATEFDRAGGNYGNPLVHEIESVGLLLADHIIAVSQATKNLIVERYDIPADQIEVVHNSIDTTEFEDIPLGNTYRYLTHMKSQGYTIVVSVGRLTLQKGLSFLLESMRMAVERNPKILLVIAGSGEQYHELIQQAADLGIAQNVMFTGFVRGAAWRDIYLVGDIFVMPSISEPFGLVALEAAGYGAAVILSRQSGVGEVLKHVLRFDYWDTHLMASQIEALASSKPLQRELTSNLQREFRRLSWSRAAEICMRRYHHLTAAAEGPQHLWDITV